MLTSWAAGKAFKNLEQANDADNVAVQTMLPHELLKRREQMYVSEVQDRILTMKKRTVETAQFECEQTVHQQV